MMMIDRKKRNMKEKTFFFFKGLRGLSQLLWKTTGIQRYGSGSKLRFTTAVSCINLAHSIQTNQKLKNDIELNEVCWGTVDSWLLFNWTEERVHMTDYSNISATGLFDPFTLDWNDWAFRVSEWCKRR
jgi:glycerol kinase